MFQIAQLGIAAKRYVKRLHNNKYKKCARESNPSMVALQ
jgi:hypothetical protein